MAALSPAELKANEDLPLSSLWRKQRRTSRPSAKASASAKPPAKASAPAKPRRQRKQPPTAKASTSAKPPVPSKASAASAAEAATDKASVSAKPPVPTSSPSRKAKAETLELAPVTQAAKDEDRSVRKMNKTLKLADALATVKLPISMPTPAAAHRVQRRCWSEPTSTSADGPFTSAAVASREPLALEGVQQNPAEEAAEPTAPTAPLGSPARRTCRAPGSAPGTPKFAPGTSDDKKAKRQGTPKSAPGTPKSPGSAPGTSRPGSIIAELLSKVCNLDTPNSAPDTPKSAAEGPSASGPSAGDADRAGRPKRRHAAMCATLSEDQVALYKYFRRTYKGKQGRADLAHECRATGVSSRASRKTMCRRLAKNMSD